MASPAQLTDAFRVAQARVAARTAGDMTAAFNVLLDPANIDGTFARYLAEAARIISTQRGNAAALAAEYYAEFRAAMGVDGSYVPLLDATMPPAQLSTGLLVSGPVTVKQSLLAGRTLEEAFARSLTLTLGTAYRYAADGGRGTIRLTAQRDPQAIGYARVTDGHPCYFCAMLASRGPVYESVASATRRADGSKYHNGCGCTAEAVFDREQPWPGKARDYEQLWKDSTSGLRGKDAINAFRRAHEGR